MPSQPSRGRATGLAFAPDEWGLLTRLPARVMIAATTAGSGGGRTVAEGIAGLDAIAAGHGSGSELVRAVVGTIYAEAVADDATVANDSIVADGAEATAGRDAAEFGNRAAGQAEVLAACRSAVAVLRARADPADAEAYREWLQAIGARVCAATRGSGDSRTGAAGQRFLTDLGDALRDRSVR